jgi:hypothetical protein
MFRSKRDNGSFCVSILKKCRFSQKSPPTVAKVELIYQLLIIYFKNYYTLVRHCSFLLELPPSVLSRTPRGTGTPD